MKPNSCEGCVFYKDGSGWVQPQPSTNGVVLVGEVPGVEEAVEGKPFVGMAGFLLSRLLKRAGLEREQFGLTYLTKCRTPEGKESWFPEACRTCRGNLFDSLRGAKVIVPMGAAALRELTGFTNITRYRGYVLEGPDGSWIVPTFAPGFLLPRRGEASSSKWVGAVIRDLRKAVRIAKEGFSKESPFYILDPAPGEAERFAERYFEKVRQDPNTYLSVDIETPYKQKVEDEEELRDESEEDDDGVVVSEPIIRVSFAYESRSAMSIPWEEPWMGVIRKLLEAPYRKLGWNIVAFDVPEIKRNGVNIQGEIYDYMWGWHILQSALPKGLETVASYFCDHLFPWKHLNGSQPAYYNAIDADAALTNGIGIERELKEAGQWELFLKHNVKLDPILLKIGRDHGVQIDVERQNKLKQKLVEEEENLVNEAQEHIPIHLRPRKRYKKFPAEVEGRLFEEVWVVGETKVCSFCGAEGVKKGDHFKGGKKNPCKAAGATIELKEAQVKEFDEILKFNPNSTSQLAEYVRFRKHPMGRDRKTKEESLGKKHVEGLYGKYQDPIYRISLAIRGVRKTLGTYVNGYQPDKLGRIYTTYSHKPKTPRLASSGVNLQNVSKRGSAYMAKEVRRTIIPREGCVFVEADSSAIEAVLVGYFMGDSTYIELAKRGVHDALTCKLLGIDFWTADIGELKKDKGYKDLRDKCKQVVHGCVTGDHEVLTKKGWVRFDAYNFTDPIAEWDPTSRQVKFAAPLGYVKKEIEEDLHQLRGNGIDVDCTGDHRWGVNTSQGKVREYRTYELPKTNTIPTYGVLMEGKVIPVQDIQRVVAAQADGSISGNQIRFHVRKQRKIEQLQDLGAVQYAKDQKDFYATIPFPAEGLLRDKTFDLQAILSWDWTSRAVFLEELPRWDGDGDNTYRTTIKANVDTVQAIAAITGYKVKVTYINASVGSYGNKGYWEVRFSFKKGNSTVALESVERTTKPYKGMIYCVTTSTGYFLLRRNNKVVVTGNSNYCMTPFLMKMLYPEVFPKQADAKKLQEAYFEMCPNVRDWHHEIRVKAQKETYLVNPWGYRGFFYNVFSKDRQGNITLGEDKNTVVSFLPQGSAACVMMDNALLIWDELGEEQKSWIPANFLVHDSYLLQVPEDYVEWASQLLIKILTRPIPQLGGLQIGCEVAVGPNWGDMTTTQLVKV